MKILVTGGGGFLGSYIVKSLLEKKHEVSSLSRHIYPHLEKLGVDNIVCDLTDKEAVEKLDLSGFEAIIHTAALAGVWGKKESYYQINYWGTQHLTEKAKSSQIKYFIYTSSPSVVFGKESISHGDESLDYPKKFYTHYAKTKAMAEKYILEQNTDKFKTLAIRPHLIWGPGDPHLFPRLIQKAKEGKLKQVGDGQNLVDIIYVENAAKAHVNALEALQKKDIGGNAYFVGQERPVKLWDFIHQVLELSKSPPIESSISFRLAYFLGGCLEGLYKFLGILKPEPPMTRFVAMQLAKDHYFSHKKARNDFGYSIDISIEEGLSRTFKK